MLLEFAATLASEKSLTAQACISAKKAIATKRNWASAAGRAQPINAASLRAAPMSGTTACNAAMQRASTRAKCPISSIMAPFPYGSPPPPPPPPGGAVQGDSHPGIAEVRFTRSTLRLLAWAGFADTVARPAAPLPNRQHAGGG